MDLESLRPQICAAAEKHNLPPAILAGLVMVESSGNPDAMRYEKDYRWKVGFGPGEVLYLPPGCTKATERNGQETSWGPGQIMGATAREMGFKGWFSELCKPAVGLDYTARYLALCLKRAKGDLVGGLLKYNGGGDPGYPDRVLAAAKTFSQLPKGDDSMFSSLPLPNWLFSLAMGYAVKSLPQLSSAARKFCVEKVEAFYQKALETEVAWDDWTAAFLLGLLNAKAPGDLAGVDLKTFAVNARKMSGVAREALTEVLQALYAFALQTDNSFDDMAVVCLAQLLGIELTEPLAQAA
ncbi:MAG: transglycosylase SLT domain-containing protein [Deltaproteobacteria bacterium]|nr:transglycosylase SLT domain-containing protein [Deltaproteobacteria bacterium]